MAKVSPFNGKWGLIDASNFEQMMDDWEMPEDFRRVIREALNNFGPDRLVEELYVDNKTGTISRKAMYKYEIGRTSIAVPFETFHQVPYFDGRPARSYYGREGGRDDTIVRFEIGNNDKLHYMIYTQVTGDIMTYTYMCRGKTYTKMFERITEKIAEKTTNVGERPCRLSTLTNR